MTDPISDWILSQCSDAIHHGLNAQPHISVVRHSHWIEPGWQVNQFMALIKTSRLPFKHKIQGDDLGLGQERQELVLVQVLLAQGTRLAASLSHDVLIDCFLTLQCYETWSWTISIGFIQRPRSRMRSSVAFQNCYLILAHHIYLLRFRIFEFHESRA